MKTKRQLLTCASCAIAHCFGYCCLCARMVENMSVDTFSPAMGYERIAVMLSFIINTPTIFVIF